MKKLIASVIAFPFQVAYTEIVLIATLGIFIVFWLMFVGFALFNPDAIMDALDKIGKDLKEKGFDK